MRPTGMDCYSRYISLLLKEKDVGLLEAIMLMNEEQRKPYLEALGKLADFDSDDEEEEENGDDVGREGNATFEKVIRMLTKRAMKTEPLRSRSRTMQLMDVPDHLFRERFRINKDSFKEIHRILGKSAVFQELQEAEASPTPIDVQLSTFLRYVTQTKYADLPTTSPKFAHIFSVARALSRLSSRYIRWPTVASRRTAIQRHFADNGFLSALGCMDVVFFELAARPEDVHFPDHYYNQQRRRFGMTGLVAIDHEGAFTSCEMYWKGCATSTKVVERSLLWRERRTRLKPGEYLLSNTGFRNTAYTIRPFTPGDLKGASEESKRCSTMFNKRHAETHSFLRKIITRLTRRFPILNLIPNVPDKNRCDIINGLLVLHNILLSLGDSEGYMPLSPFDDWEEEFADEEELLQQSAPSRSAMHEVDELEEEDVGDDIRCRILARFVSF